MAEATVAGCVLTIIASLSRGIEVLEKIRDSGASKLRRIKKVAEVPVQTQLNKSLRRALHDIDEEYQRCQSAVGIDFAIGDGSWFSFTTFIHISWLALHLMEAETIKSYQPHVSQQFPHNRL